MNLFGRRLKHTWEFFAQGVIWRVHPAINGRLIGEERDLGKKRTSFFCVEQRSGKVLWRDVMVAEAWWVGIALVDKDLLLVHGYATPDLPGQRGLTAIDAATGTILWANSTWELGYTTPNGFVVLSTAANTPGEVLIDRRTGSPKPQSAIQAAPWIADSAPSAGISEAQFPVPFDPTQHQGSEALHAAAKRYVRPDKSGITEYLALPHHIVLTTFERTGDGRSDHHQTKVDIRILDASTGKERMKETIATKASGRIPDTFFSQDNMVFFVKERKVLCAVRLKS